MLAVPSLDLFTKQYQPPSSTTCYWLQLLIFSLHGYFSQVAEWGEGVLPWMKEEKGIIHRWGGAHLRWPVSTSVQFSLRNEGSSEYKRLFEGRESLCPNFQTFQDPRHQFHRIARLVSGLLFRGLIIATYAGRNDSWEIFALLKSLKIRALENFVCLLRHTFTGS